VELLLIKVESFKNFILLEAIIIAHFVVLAISFWNDTIGLGFLGVDASFFGLVLLGDVVFVRF
jgi:hypothetical protein